MRKIYLAGPLFNEMELNRNLEIADILRKWGYEVFLPQEEAGLALGLITGKNKHKIY